MQCMQFIHVFTCFIAFFYRKFLYGCMICTFSIESLCMSVWFVHVKENMRFWKIIFVCHSELSLIFSLHNFLLLYFFFYLPLFYIKQHLTPFSLYFITNQALILAIPNLSIFKFWFNFFLLNIHKIK